MGIIIRDNKQDLTAPDPVLLAVVWTNVGKTRDNQPAIWEWFIQPIPGDLGGWFFFLFDPPLLGIQWPLRHLKTSAEVCASGQLNRPGTGGSDHRHGWSCFEDLVKYGGVRTS